MKLKMLLKRVLMRSARLRLKMNKFVIVLIFGWSTKINNQEGKKNKKYRTSLKLKIFCKALQGLDFLNLSPVMCRVWCAEDYVKSAMCKVPFAVLPELIRVCFHSFCWIILTLSRGGFWADDSGGGGAKTPALHVLAISQSFQVGLEWCQK